MTAFRPQERVGGAPASTPAAAPRSLPGPSAATAVLVGGSYGALLFGGAVSLLHLLHNRLDGVRDALAGWVFFALLWGLAAAVATAIGALARRLFARDRSRGSNHATAALQSDLAWGLVLFHVAFFVPFALYGRTYDEAAFAGPPRTAMGMIAVLAVAGVVVAALAALTAIAIARRLASIASSGRPQGSLRRLGIGALLASLAVHVALPLVLRALPERAQPAASVFRPLRAGDRAASRVVLVGLDGADWRVLGPMAERGEAPVFARLMKEGAWGPLHTLRGENSATIWASIYTGKRPRQHGVLDFYRTHLPGMAGPGVFPVHRTFFVQGAELLAARGLVSRRIADRSFLHTRPLWEILDDLGLSVGVVDGYHYSVPARRLETAGGFSFSYALNALSARPGWNTDALDAAEREVLFQPPDQVRYYAPHARLGDFDWQAATLLDALAAEGQPDFVNLYSHQPDAVQHQRWKWFEPERFLAVDPADLERWGDAIPEVYRAFDRFLGTLVERLEPGTTLIVVSDHGHSPTLVDQLYTQHRHGPPGIVLLWGAGVGRGVELAGAHVYDVTPTILHLLGFPVGADMAGHVLRQALEPAVADSPVRILESYDAFAPSRFEGSAGPDLTAEELERLRALGYL